ncbi:hypothetical protein D9M69_550650 [compost metagenome]
MPRTVDFLSAIKFVAGAIISFVCIDGLAQYKYAADVYYYVPQMPRTWGGACFPHLSSDALLARHAVYEGFKRQAKDKKGAAAVSVPVELGKKEINGKAFEYSFRWTYRLMGPSGVVAKDSGSGMDDIVRAAAVCYGKASKTILMRIDDKHIDVQCNASHPKPSTDEVKIKQMGDCDYSILKPAAGDFFSKK